jgi:hypothetical protein
MSKLRKLFALLATALSLTMFDITTHAFTYEYTISTGGGFRNKLNQFKNHYSIFITIMMSLMLITSIAIFVWHCYCLASSGSNSQKRALAIQNLLTTGICLSAQSAISLVLSLLFWGFFI